MASTVQSRVSAFESLKSNGAALPKDPIDFLEAPLSPMPTASLQPNRPSPPSSSSSSSSSSSPPNGKPLARTSSLIDLKDWVVDDGIYPTTKLSSTKTPTQSAFTNGKRQSTGNTNGHSPHNTPLINLQSPPRPKPKPPNLNTGGIVPAKPPQLPPRKPSLVSLKSAASGGSGQASSKSQLPQPSFLYPPRRQDSLSVDHGLEPHSRASSHGATSSISSFHSVSLSSDTDPSTPGSVANFIATFPIDQEIQRTSSTSTGQSQYDTDSISLTESYEEVSASVVASPAAAPNERTLDWQAALSKGKPPVPPKLPERPHSTKPSPHGHLFARSPPPTVGASTPNSSLPSSPTVRPAISANSSTSTLSTPPAYSPYQPRRAAPPPPPSRSSDRSSILSTTTTTSLSSRSSTSLTRTQVASYGPPPPHTHVHPPGSSASSVTGVSVNGMGLKAKRPTPVPLAARKRYEAVFIRNVIQRRKVSNAKGNGKPTLLSPSEARGRRAAGWRGLSVDLITGGGDGADHAAPAHPKHPLRSDSSDEEVLENDEALGGAIVRVIWKKSGLDSARLAEIWNECDTTSDGSLTIDTFVKGMWRIDEELRRTQVQAIKCATSTSIVGSGFRSSARSSAASGFGSLGNTSTTSSPPPPKLPPRSKEILR
ncbi:hypothetical protein CPB83DRAFT_841458 [Crepidotus variabilis]|uniref:EH domain-containing protein n=1 Tax=Crepidotus variabilis TaxID=179855 RepID=A0A9P6ETQ7_9AGAR|nr:hypothetical protein CPB83DRAFT_841458 [Crepidotus variabilis]